MRPWRKIALAAAGVWLIGMATVWWLPAAWATSWLDRRLPDIRLQGVSGTVWHGHAERVLTADGKLLGRANWHLARRALIGHTQLQLDIAGPQLDARGELQQDAGGDAVWRDVDVRVDLALLAGGRARRLPLPLAGELTLHSGQLTLAGGWPTDGAAELRWRNAALRVRQTMIAFGQLDARLAARDGVIHAQWHDVGDGPLQTHGTLLLSPLGWRLVVELKARGDDPLLARWLATLGKPDASGTYHLERRGGLAAASRTETTAP